MIGIFYRIHSYIKTPGISTQYDKSRISTIFHTCHTKFSLQNELKELEEKFRKAMVANAGLDNEKSALNYQVTLIKKTFRK